MRRAAALLPVICSRHEPCLCIDRCIGCTYNCLHLQTCMYHAIPTCSRLSLVHFLFYIPNFFCIHTDCLLLISVNFLCVLLNDANISSNQLVVLTNTAILVSGLSGVVGYTVQVKLAEVDVQGNRV